jgi:hypothetical protein
MRVAHTHNNGHDRLDWCWWERINDLVSWFDEPNEEAGFFVLSRGPYSGDVIQAVVEYI